MQIEVPGAMIPAGRVAYKVNHEGSLSRTWQFPITLTNLLPNLKVLLAKMILFEKTKMITKESELVIVLIILLYFN